MRCAVGGDGGGWEAVVGALGLFAPSSHDTVWAKHSTNYEKMLDLFHWSHFELLLEFVHTSTRTGIALWTTTQFFFKASKMKTSNQFSSFSFHFSADGCRS